MNILIFGVHSFVDSPVKVGIQHIAEGLSKLGNTIDYISIFSSPFDMFRLRKNQRFKRVWLCNQNRIGFKIKPRLTEYALKVFFPASKLILKHDWQIKLGLKFTHSFFSNRKYDACIHDVTGNIIFLPNVNSKLRILRLNDNPEGFSYNLSSKIIKTHRNNINNGIYDEIWAAHRPLKRYIDSINPLTNTLVIPNGVSDRYLNQLFPIERKANSAVYIGSHEKWLDFELLDATARRLPHWNFDIIGVNANKKNFMAQNINFLPPVKRNEVPTILSNYQVGLIPFKNYNKRLDYVERPLKFLEYIGAGLGVASTDVGALKEGMENWASYGNTVQDFSRAIVIEEKRARKRSPDIIRSIIKENCWSKINLIFYERLKCLQY